jgi:hypothetical protein
MSWLGAVTGRSAETNCGRFLTCGNWLAGISPRGLVADRPPAGSLIKESWPPNPAQGRVEALTNRDDLWPAAWLARAGHILGGAPSIDAQRAVGSPTGPGQPETSQRNVGEDLGLPRQFFQVVDVRRLEDHITGRPGHALPTAQRNRARSGNTESGEYRRWRERHRQNLPDSAASSCHGVIGSVMSHTKWSHRVARQAEWLLTRVVMSDDTVSGWIG